MLVVLGIFILLPIRKMVLLSVNIVRKKTVLHRKIPPFIIKNKGMFSIAQPANEKKMTCLLRGMFYIIIPFCFRKENVTINGDYRHP